MSRFKKIPIDRDEFVRLAPDMTREELAVHFKISRSTATKRCVEFGVMAKPKRQPKPVLKGKIRRKRGYKGFNEYLVGDEWMTLKAVHELSGVDVSYKTFSDRMARHATWEKVLVKTDKRFSNAKDKSLDLDDFALLMKKMKPGSLWMTVR